MAGEGAWKANHEYQYKYVDKTFLNEPASNVLGFITSVGLTIHSHSDNVLIGRFTDASTTIISDVQESGNWTIVPIDKQFKIHMRNGVIDSLSADRTMTASEINILKTILSKFQVDTKANNVVKSVQNHLPDANTNNGFYTTKETTVLGTCETNYDISRLPEYLAYPKYGSISSLAKYAAGEDVIEIKKHLDTKNCEKLNGTECMDNQTNGGHSIIIDTRVVVTGSLSTFIIHSSETTIKMSDRSNFVYLSLESMKHMDGNSNGSQTNNMVDIGNLVCKAE